MAKNVIDANLINPLGVVVDVNGAQGQVKLLPASSRVTINTNTDTDTITIDATGGVSSVNSLQGALNIVTSVGLDVDSVDDTITLYLNPATPVAIGGIIIGNGLYLTEGSVANVDWTQLPIATSSALGAIKVPAAATSGLNLDAQGNLTFANNPATTTSLGVVKVGANLSVTADGTLSANAPPYVLPIASDTVLGGIRVGTGLSIDGFGVLSNAYSYSLPIASSSILGGVKVGSGLSVAGDGTLSASPYSLPVATATSLGGVIVGNRLTVLGDGTVNVPIATSTVLGVVKAGTNITIAADGTISSSSGYTLPIATAGALGGIRVGSGLTIDSGTGILSANGYTLPTASASTLGGVRVGANLAIDGSGVLSGTYSYTLPPATASLLGGVKIGAGLSIDGSGLLTADAGESNPYIKVTAQTGASAAGALNGSIAIGGNTQTNTSIDSVAIGSNATTNGNNALAIGQGASATGNNSLAIGPLTSTSSTNAIAIGANSIANVSNTVSFGNNSATPIRRTLVNVAGGANSGEAITWEQLANPSSRGLVKGGGNIAIAGDGTLSYTLPIASSTVLGGIKIGDGLSIDGAGVVSVIGGGGGAVGSVNGKTGAVTITGSNGVVVDNSGTSIALSAEVAEAPMDGSYNARRNGTWVTFTPGTASVVQVASSGASSTLSLVKDDGTTGAHIAVVKTLKQGSNIVLSDFGDYIQIDANVLTSVASVNTKLPDGTGNVTLAASDVNALAQDGSNAATANINFGGFRATNVADPVNPQDAVTLALLQSAITIDPGTF